MKRVEIIKDTFICGKLARKGEKYDVDDRSALYLTSSNKAIEIGADGAEKKEDLTGVMTSIPKLKKEDRISSQIGDTQPSTTTLAGKKEITPPPAPEEDAKNNAGVNDLDVEENKSDENSQSEKEKNPPSSEQGGQTPPGKKGGKKRGKRK